mgnify:CR=1 FL=1
MDNKKTIFITGANRGIGLAMVKESLKKKFFVIGSYRNKSNTKDFMSLSSYDLKTIELDVTDEEAIKKVKSEINVKIDYLICNAGINNGYGSFYSEDHTSKQLIDVFNVNVIGSILTVRNLIDLISDNGKIIFISSIMGVQKHEGSRATAYRASKAAVNNLMISMSNDLKPKGITVTAFHPGWVKTDMGGPNASLTAEESARNLIHNFLELTIKDSGLLYNYDGTLMEF